MTWNIIDVTDIYDDRLTDYTRLKDVALRSRREPAEGIFIAESNTVIDRALAAGYQPLSLFMGRRWLTDRPHLVDAAKAHDVPLYVADDDVIESITGYHLHRGALAAMRRPQLRSVNELLEQVSDRSGRFRVAILEDLVDHTNVGAAFRSAAALGVDAVLVTPRCADPLYRRSIRVSMGTVLQVPWTRIDSWPDGVEMVQHHGYHVAGMTLGDDAITLNDLVRQDHQKLALIFGAEGHGLASSTDQFLDTKVTIPMMNGVDSLNVAASLAVAFYATCAQL